MLVETIGVLCHQINGIISDVPRVEILHVLCCVDVVGCFKCEELVCWEEAPEGARLEGKTDFCLLCEIPQIYYAAVRGLSPAEGPIPVKFSHLDPRDRFSLKPRSLAPQFSGLKISEVEKSPSISAAVAGARATATQFSKKEDNDERKICIQNSCMI
ncbi:hypothetical protein ACHQM5_008914 [Ranunculus cassubicifolius]